MRFPQLERKEKKKEAAQAPYTWVVKQLTRHSSPSSSLSTTAAGSRQGAYISLCRGIPIDADCFPLGRRTWLPTEATTSLPLPKRLGAVEVFLGVRDGPPPRALLRYHYHRPQTDPVPNQLVYQGLIPWVSGYPANSKYSAFRGCGNPAATY